jgi:cytochrome c553
VKVHVVLGACLLPVLGSGAHAAGPDEPFVDVRRFAPISGDARAGRRKSSACSSCHGADGHSISSEFPNLAAQAAGYTYLQLESYQRRWRTNPIMEPLVADLSDTDMRDLAVYYADLAAAPGSRSAEDTSEGAALYQNGDAEKGIPPCQGCHGESGGGPPRLSDTPLRNVTTYPALAG